GNKKPGSSEHGEPGLVGESRSVADADPAPHAVAITIDDRTASHGAAAAICVRGVIGVGAAIVAAVIRRAEAETQRESGCEAPAEPAAAPVAASAMPVAAATVPVLCLSSGG